MVDVSGKEITVRSATAHAFVAMSYEVLQRLPNNPKGDPLEVARIAGISAAKKTSDLIPLCHQIPLTHVALEFQTRKDGIEITATAATAAMLRLASQAVAARSPGSSPRLPPRPHYASHICRVPGPPDRQCRSRSPNPLRLFVVMFDKRRTACGARVYDKNRLSPIVHSKSCGARPQFAGPGVSIGQ